jgi:hypothetical protein
VHELDQREQIPPHAQPHLAANAPPPSLVTEEARSAVASDGQATPPPRNPRSEARGRHEPSRNTRSAGDSIAVTATGSDGKRRTIMIRPTSQQDIYYYAARRELPASSVGRP